MTNVHKFEIKSDKYSDASSSSLSSSECISENSDEQSRSQSLSESPERAPITLKVACEQSKFKPLPHASGQHDKFGCGGLPKRPAQPLGDVSSAQCRSFQPKPSPASTRLAEKGEDAHGQTVGHPSDDQVAAEMFRRLQSKALAFGEIGRRSEMKKCVSKCKDSIKKALDIIKVENGSFAKF